MRVLTHVFFGLLFCGGPCLAEFALREGDKVAFLGDSITAAHNYSKVIETYTVLRFPERQIEFINVGRGGETAHGSLQRLDEAVFANGATVLTVAYGINDIGWGTKANEASKAAYLKGIQTIIQRCQERGIRVFICSAAITDEDPDKAAEGYLQTMCDEGLELARELGAGTIDVMRSMREVQRRILAANQNLSATDEPTRLHVADGVHLNDLGQMAMAWAILKGLGAPAEVSALALNAATAQVERADACAARDISITPDGGAFVRLDDRLPLNLHSLWMLMGWHIPISQDLNEYRLQISRLNEGDYAVFAGDRKLGDWSASELADGLNIASATADPWEPGGVWDGQGRVVTQLTNARDQLDQTRANIQQWLTAHPNQQALLDDLNAIQDQLVQLQRGAAQPTPIRFNIQPLNQ